MRHEQFDFLAGQKAKDEGIQRVAENNVEFLDIARKTAVAICERTGTVTTDEIREACPVVPKHPNAWGAVFRDRRFQWTGEMVQSSIVSRHGGLQRVWGLK